MRTAFAIISIMLAFGASAREIVAEATHISYKPIAASEIVPHAPVLEPVDVGSVPREEYETRLAAVIERIESAAAAIGIPQADVERIVAVAREKRIDPVALAAVFSAVEKHGLDPVCAQAVIMAAVEAGVDVGIVESILSAVSADGIDAKTIEEAIAEAVSSGVSPVAIEKVAAAVLAAKPFASRFDILEPCAFSRLWAIKIEALEREKKGEPTDELYELYWRLFSEGLRDSRGM